MNIHIIENKIYVIRGKKVMLDSDLAVLYGVETKALNQAVKRNIQRFPADFMFQLTKEEVEASRSQIVTLNMGNGQSEDILRSQIVTSRRGNNIKYLPYAFTEQGVAMLSSVLKSETAIEVNIQIMRTFTKLREILGSNKELKDKIEQLENKYDKQFRVVFEAINQLLDPPEEPKPQIGFRDK